MICCCLPCCILEQCRPVQLGRLRGRRSLPTRPRGAGSQCVVCPQPCSVSCTRQHSLIYKAERSELSDGRLGVA